MQHYDCQPLAGRLSGRALCRVNTWRPCGPYCVPARVCQRQSRCLCTSCCRRSKVHKGCSPRRSLYRLLMTCFPDGGYLSSSAEGRIGRGSKLPPQFGQTPVNSVSTQLRQKVHTNVQIIGSCESEGKSRSQCSQFGRSFSIQSEIRHCRRSGRPQEHGMHQPRCWPDFPVFPHTSTQSSKRHPTQSATR